MPSHQAEHLPSRAERDCPNGQAPRGQARRAPPRPSTSPLGGANTSPYLTTPGQASGQRTASAARDDEGFMNYLGMSSAAPTKRCRSTSSSDASSGEEGEGGNAGEEKRRRKPGRQLRRQRLLEQQQTESVSPPLPSPPQTPSPSQLRTPPLSPPLRTWRLSSSSSKSHGSPSDDELCYSTDEDEARHWVQGDGQAEAKGKGKKQKKKVRWQGIGEGTWGGGHEKRRAQLLPGPDGDVNEVRLIDGGPPQVRELWDVREWVGDLTIAVVGASGVGKTALIQRYCDHEWDRLPGPTVGCDFKQQIVLIKDEAWRTKIYDTAGQERFHAAPWQYYHGAQGVILAYDICDRQSFLDLEYWISETEKFAPSDVVWCLVGTKLDEAWKGRRQVSATAGQTLAAAHGMLFCEVSSKSSQGYKEPFHGILGQIVANKNTLDAARIKPLSLLARISRSRWPIALYPIRALCSWLRGT